MKIHQLKIATLAGVLVAGLALVAGFSANVFAQTDPSADSRSSESEIMPISETTATADTPLGPTFRAHEESDEIELWAGKNLILLGNSITSDLEAPSGLMFVAGNSLAMNNVADYGFLFGNIVNFSGQTNHDLYVAGNVLSIKKDAKVGRDIFAAGSSLTVETNLPGDLSFAGESVTLKNVEIAGNVNLDVDKIIFEGDVKISGTLTYNETAEVRGKDSVTYDAVEIYEVNRISDATILVTRIYAKILSIAGLFIVMAIICAFWHKFHDKISGETDLNRFGVNLAVGLGVFVATPILILVSLFTVVAAPLAIVLGLIYGSAIYLSQGFAGAWLGHLILEKLFKVKGNIFAESFIGILVLGILALIPYVGIITGFLGMLLGLGLMFSFIRPVKQPKVIAEPSK